MRSIQEKSRKTINSDLKEELIKSIKGEVRFDDISRQMYSTDGSIYSILPVGVTIPANSDDVSTIIEICNKNNVAIKNIERVGNYAVRIHFDDGHNTGIYSWRLLRSMAQNSEKIIKNYYNRLKKI